MPLVSVVVPAYNHAEYIEFCLDSVADSAYASLEILVMDDGSTDDTYVRACTWMENNAHRVDRVSVQRQTNQGINRTLNSLVALAEGDFIAVLASDDALEPNGIALRVSALESHPEWLAVFGDCSIIDEAGREEAMSGLSAVRHDLRALQNPRRIARELILRWYVPGPAMLARSSTYGRACGVGLYDENLEVEDRDFYLRLLAINALGFIPERVARYRMHGIRSESRQLTVLREGVKSEWGNVAAFKGLNRWLLILVAVRGSASLNASLQVGRKNRARGLALSLIGNSLGIAKRFAYVLHRFAARVPEAPRQQPNGRGPWLQ